MDYRDTTGIGSSSHRVQTGANVGAEADSDDEKITLDTEEMANRFVVAVIGGVASAAVTRYLFGKGE